MLVGVFTITGLFGNWFWLLDLTAHARWALLWVGIVLALALLGLRAWKSFLTALLTIALNAVFIFMSVYLPQSFSTSPVAVTNTRPALKVLQLNVLFSNRNFAQVKSLIDREKPDVIGFEEFVAPWPTELETTGALRDYPYRLVSGDLGLYSRHPLTHLHATRIFKNDPARMLVQGTLAWEGQPIDLLVAHTPVPGTAERTLWQHKTFYKMARMVHDTPGEDIVIGDMNTTPWSAQYRYFLNLVQLKDTRIGRGVMATWPNIPFGYWFPLDMVFISPGLQTLSARVGPDVGSDHLPYIVTVSLRPKAELRQ